MLDHMFLKYIIYYKNKTESIHLYFLMVDKFNVPILLIF